MLKRLMALVLVLAASQVVAQETAKVEVTAERANIMSGRDVLGTVNKGTVLPLISEQNSWYQIEFEAGGQKRKGWIRQADVKRVENQNVQPSAPAAAAQPRPVEWLRVTAERAEVKSGSETVGTLLRNQVLPISDANGRWQKVEIPGPDSFPVAGFVLDSHIEKINALEVGPSLDGATPYSISTATPAVDWTTGDVTLVAAVPVAESTAVRLEASETNLADVELKVAAGAVSLQMKGSAWLSVTREGTRSLWLVEGDETPRRHRVDLVPLDLGTSVTARRFNNFDEGLLISLPVSGLLPGYLVEHAYQTDDGRTSRVQVLSSAKGTSPRVADIQKGTAEWPQIIRVVVPFATQSAESIHHLFVIRQPDGAQSRTIKVQRRGDEIVAAATELSAALPLPVDATVKVPSVELLTAEKAVEAVRAAGLEPTLVTQPALERVELTTVRESLVLRQGLPPDELALVGTPLMLGVRTDGGLSFIDESSVGIEGLEPMDQVVLAEPAPGGDEPTETVAGGLVLEEVQPGPVTTVDTGEELQFIDVQQTGLVGGSGGLQDTLATTNPSTTPTTGASSTDNGGFITGGLITDSDSLTPNSSVTPSTDPSTGVLVDPSPDLLVPVNPDPGLLLDPTLDAETALITGILKIILDAILHQPDPSNLPGPIGQAITEALAKQEAPLQQAQDQEAESEAVSAILEVLLTKLRLSLTDTNREQALADWNKARTRAAALSMPIDRNGNGVAADDVVIHFVVWLHQRGLFNPASNVVIAQDSLGNTVATMSSTPNSLDWLKNLPPLIKPGQSSPPPNLPASGPSASPSQPIDPLASVPEGKPVVTAGHGPDMVKIPEVNEKLVSEAKPSLDDLGIRIANLPSLFATDRVIESSPEQGEWVKSDASVELQILRRVPDLLKLTLTAAEEELKRHKLTSSTVGKTFPEDIVIEQLPEAGQYTTADQPVKLALAIVAPVVEGLLLPEARDALTKRDLKWVFRTRSFDVDRVFQQSPPAGALVGHGDGIELTLQLPVPDVRGMTLAKAREAAQQWDLKLVTANRLARDTDIVRGQKPAPKEWVLHESDLQPGPVVTRAPDLVKQTIAQAEMKLKAEDLEARRVGELLATDKIMKQTPEAGAEIERGQPIQLDARITLPDFVGTGIVDARDALQQLGVDLRVKVDGAIGRADVVFSQKPAGETLVYPRTEVLLEPGVNVPDFAGMTTGQADAELQRVGLKGTLRMGGEIETTDRRLDGQQLIGGQKPQAGLYRRADLTDVQLVVNKYVLAVRTVPDVVSGEQVGPAVAAVRRADLNPIIVFRGRTYEPQAWAAFVALQQIANAAQGDTNPIIVEVVDQSPEAGARVIAGTTVRIIVESDGIGGNVSR